MSKREREEDVIGVPQPAQRLSPARLRAELQPRTDLTGEEGAGARRVRLRTRAAPTAGAAAGEASGEDAAQSSGEEAALSSEDDGDESEYEGEGEAEEADVLKTTRVTKAPPRVTKRASKARGGASGTCLLTRGCTARADAPGQASEGLRGAVVRPRRAPRRPPGAPRSPSLARRSCPTTTTTWRKRWTCLRVRYHW